MDVDCIGIIGLLFEDDEFCIYECVVLVSFRYIIFIWFL